MNDYRNLEPQIESGIGRHLANTVRSEINARKEDFSISRAETNLSYDAHVKELRKFLMKQARQRYESNEKIAEALGISRQTLYNWESE